MAIFPYPLPNISLQYLPRRYFVQKVDLLVFSKKCHYGHTVHHHKLDVLHQHSQGAFLLVKERDLFLLDPQPTVCEDLDPTYQSLIFQDPSLEESDLGATMGTEVSGQPGSSSLPECPIPESRLETPEVSTAASGLVN